MILHLPPTYDWLWEFVYRSTTTVHLSLLFIPTVLVLLPSSPSHQPRSTCIYLQDGTYTTS